MNEWIGQFHTVVVLVFFVLSLVLLSKATDQLIDSAVVLSKKLGLSQMMIGATILSLGTTLPEVASSMVATMNGNGTFGLGNAIGSMVTNTALVLGVGAVAGIIPVKKESQSKLGVLVVVTLVFILGSFPGGNGFESGFLPQWMGIVLLGVIPLYIWFLLKNEPESMAEEVEVEQEKAKTTEEEQSSRPTWLSLVILVVSSLFVTLGATLLVATVEISASRFGVPDAVIASTVVAFGTSVPEISTTVVAVRYGHGELAIGNVLGANIMNILLVMGATLSLLPGGLMIPGSYYIIQFPVLVLLLIFFAYLVFHPKKEAIRKREGMILLSLYVGYLVLNVVLA